MSSIMRIVSLTLLVVVMGGIAYNEINTRNVNVKVDIKNDRNPAEVLPELGRVTNVRQTNASKNEYEFTIKVSKKRQSILTWLRSKDWVENAEINE